MTGALAGQVTQAVAGLGLQVVAARELGAGGLAVFSLVYGAVVLATAVCSGLVGDSLTVLDRTEPRVRAGLHVAAAGVCALTGAGGAALAVATGLLSPAGGVLLGLAAAAFVLEDVLRRLLMAAGRFWSLPAVDLTALALSLGTLAACAAAGPLSLGSFVLALLAGQGGAAAVALALLPAVERPRGPWRRPDLRAVAAFGVWRAAAQAIRPALLTVLRIAVVGLAGAAAYGPLEAARVYTAPALVVVAGLGSYLLPAFAAGVADGAAAGLRRADRAALRLAAAVAVLGVAVVAAQPLAGPLLTGGDYPLPVAAVAGWSLYAVASALLLPYAGLASVLRRQRQVLLLRGLELGSLALVVGLAAGGAAVWAPAALATGPLLVVWALRRRVLVPLARTPEPAPPVPVG